jgi:hypothetical protein
MRIRNVNGQWRDIPVVPVTVGNWAAHLMPPAEFDMATNGHGWRVSYVPTGTTLRTFADDMTREDAVAVAKLLHKRVPAPPLERSQGGTYGRREYRYIVEAVIAEALS